MTDSDTRYQSDGNAIYLHHAARQEILCEGVIEMLVCAARARAGFDAEVFDEEAHRLLELLDKRSSLTQNMRNCLVSRPLNLLPAVESQLHSVR